MHRWISQVITEYYNNYNYHISYFIATSRVSAATQRSHWALYEQAAQPCGIKLKLFIFIVGLIHNFSDWINDNMWVRKIKILHVFEIEMETHCSLYDCQEIKCNLALWSPLQATFTLTGVLHFKNGKYGQEFEVQFLLLTLWYKAYELYQEIFWSWPR